VGLKRAPGLAGQVRQRLSAEPLVGLKHDSKPRHLDVQRLSAEPLVGLKQIENSPLSIQLSFQPNPSWV